MTWQEVDTAGKSGLVVGVIMLTLVLISYPIEWFIRWWFR